MLKVKQAINYKSSDGTMKNTGVLCEVGVVGGDSFKLEDYISSVSFNNVTFPENFDLVLNLPNFKKNNADSVSQTITFLGTNLKSIKIITPLKNFLHTGTNFFHGCKQLERVDLTEFEAVFVSLTNMFLGCTSLVEILGVIDCSNATTIGSNFVSGCKALKEIRFKENTIKISIDFQWSALLSDESIQSIIDGLAYVETAQTLRLHADVKAKLTEAQIAQITSKNWTLA